jgi:diguanylate cyclase (GGDEF)-like protein
MRSVTGFRFFLYIIMPLVLAAAAALALSLNLLRYVENGNQSLERSRNFSTLTEAVEIMEMNLTRLATDNARWEDAAVNTSGEPNNKWFEGSLASPMSLGFSYDMVAVIDAQSGAVLLGRDRSTVLEADADLFGGRKITELHDLLDPMNARRGVVSGFVNTSKGPLAYAMAPIASVSVAPQGNGRLLYFARKLDPSWVDSQRRSLLVEGLKLEVGAKDNNNGVSLKGPDGQETMHLSWDSGSMAQAIIESSWVKISGGLGLLFAVMSGIGFVCWRLVQQLANDEGKAKHQANHDHLTGLPNRLALTTRMRALQDTKDRYALAFADLDGFKEVNDSYGHEFGDRILMMVGDAVRELAPGADLCCRLGGDEFVVLYVGPNSMQLAKDYSAKLIDMLKQPFDMEGRLASVGASIGIAECAGHHDVTEMLRRSDIAMYKAKTNGKNRFCVFDTSFDQERNETLAIAGELRTIIAERAIEIVFQPKVSARGNEVTGLEALARWPATSLRNVPPEKFINIAETTGLIEPLGDLILEKSCEMASAWSNIRIAVNISAVQLNNPSFVRNSLAILKKYGIEPNRMEFEITESSLINDTERAKQMFKALQQSGIKIALDDFGTGFSSIGYLRTFQFDRIKIDKSIINKVLTSPSELAVVQGTLLVARGLAAEVTAEGVESLEQAKVLRLAGCTEFQGFVYYKPMTAANVTGLLKKAKLAKIPRTEVA